MTPELPLIVLGGLLGSSHCVGMCGGFAIMIGAGAQGWSALLGRQALYSAGRLCTYATLGGCLGYAGAALARQLPALVNVQAILSLAAGALLVVQGLSGAGFFRRRRAMSGKCWNIRLLRPLFAGHGGAGCFLAGLATGFLPCGLVYAYLALAASSSDFFRGIAVMAAFGLGTVPLMVLTGTGAGLLAPARRIRIVRLAAWCVVATGIITLARGASFLVEERASEACPFCRVAGSPDVSGGSIAK